MLGPSRAFECEREDFTLIVKPKNDENGLHYSDVQQESNVVYRLLDRSDLANVIFDLSKTEMVGSILIGVMFRLARKVKSQHGAFAVCCANKNVLESLNNVSLLKLWPHFETREEALRDFMTVESQH